MRQKEPKVRQKVRTSQRSSFNNTFRFNIIMKITRHRHKKRFGAEERRLMYLVPAPAVKYEFLFYYQ